MGDELQIAGPSIQSQTPSLRDLAAVFFRHQKLFVVSFGVVLTVGVLYAFVATSYTARMKVVVRRGRIDPAVSPTQTVAPLMQSDAITEEELNSEAELFRDEDVLREIVARTGLADRRSWISWLRRESPEQKIEHAERRLAKNLDVQPVRKSQLITISYRSSDPRLAASVLKAASEVYLAHQAQMQRPPGQQVFFDEQVNISRRELKRVQQEFENFTRTRKVVSAALERDLTLQKLSEAQAGEFGLQASVAEAVERSRSLDEKLQQLPQRRVSQVRNADNPQLQEKLKSRLLELELETHRTADQVSALLPSGSRARSADRASKSCPRSRKPHSLARRTYGGQSRLRLGKFRTGEDRRRYSGLAEKGSGCQATSRGVPVQGTTTGAERSRAGDLDQKLKAAEERYLLYAGKREEARIGDALDHTGILNVAVAQPPHVPALPSWPMWAATCLSFAAAFVFSTGSVFIADYADRSVRTPSELIALLGTPVLASLPPAQNQRRAALRGL
jgi:uncharacterized protein involved in exopolysaccharide biosynthesis